MTSGRSSSFLMTLCYTFLSLILISSSSYHVHGAPPGVLNSQENVKLSRNAVFEQLVGFIGNKSCSAPLSLDAESNSLPALGHDLNRLCHLNKTKTISDVLCVTVVDIVYKVCTANATQLAQSDHDKEPTNVVDLCTQFSEELSNFEVNLPASKHVSIKQELESRFFSNNSKECRRICQTEGEVVSPMCLLILRGHRMLVKEKLEGNFLVYCNLIRTITPHTKYGYFLTTRRAKT